ncbi:MAG TPA: alkaline phosphatase family protein, partial [Stellaceae bacterium]|nr:alkaline phosphatase family protein [Stellaceae bacterium]
MKLKHTGSMARSLSALALGVILCSGPLAPSFAANDPAQAFATTTPIKHLIVIFQENSSFDHYFGTYPNAANTDGTTFTPVAGTPTVNGFSPGLLTQNPNTLGVNTLINPFRFLQKQAVTSSQNHNYGAEQQAYNNGLMNNFKAVGSGTNFCPAPAPAGCQNVGYFDGNTVTALWNYAQNFAMSDNHYGTTFGPSTPGALNLISGQTHGVLRVTRTAATGALAVMSPQATNGQSFFLDSDGLGTQTGDTDPAFDDCGSTSAVAMANSGTTPQTSVMSPTGPTGGT